MFQRVFLRIDLVLERIAGSAASRTGWVAALNDEVADDAVEDDAVVEPLVRQKDEIVDRLRCIPGSQIDNDFTSGCHHPCAILAVRVDLHRRR